MEIGVFLFRPLFCAGTEPSSCGRLPCGRRLADYTEGRHLGHGRAGGGPAGSMPFRASPFSSNASAPVLHAWPATHTCQPGFMVIGAPKCGSTSLFKYLEAHPDVQQPAKKELCYFSKFKRWLTAYRPSPITVWDQYVAGLAGMHTPRGGGRGTEAGRNRLASLHPVRRLLESPTGAELALSSAAGVCRARAKIAFEGCPFYLHERLAATQLRTTFPQMRAIALLRNPRERTVSAFNDYVRVGRIKSGADIDGQMQRLVESKIAMLRQGERSLEDFDMRILTSAVYIHGLAEWGRVWPIRQLLVVQSEEMFERTEAVVLRVQDFLGLRRAIPASAYETAHNRNRIKTKARASARLNSTLDAFFAPYNEQLYAWMAERSVQHRRWPNGSSASTL